MKVRHIVRRAYDAPKVDKTYAARVGDVRFNGSSLIISWDIYSHKHRVKKRRSLKKSLAKEATHA